jgi:CubicO group peptidase (beta-lactamase class C family)
MSGLRDAGRQRLHEALARRVDEGEVPGVVALVASGDDVHVDVIGHRAFDDPEPIGRDAIFRIASMTKPIVGVAAMSMIEDGVLELADAVERWLPELADRQVLRTLASPLDDTVPAERPITVEDVLSFRLGWGSVMAPPSTYPVQAAERDLDLRTFGPPWPPSGLTPDEWIARLGTLPLLDQPGARWRYAGGAQVAGVLLERAAGRPLAEVLREHVFEPLHMADSAFYCPASKRDRFMTQYTPNPETGAPEVLDRPDGWWSTPPAMPDANGWLVSTMDDLWSFASALAAAGGAVLTPASVELMLIDRTTAADRAESAVFLAPGGWGLMMAVPSADGGTGRPGGYGWDGGLGTSWRNDPSAELTGIMLTQLAVTSPATTEIATEFWDAAYDAVA